jgi:membrane associated rhomboid family serine protease
MQTVFTKRVLSATSSRSPTRVFSSFNPLEKVTQNNTKSVQNVQQNSIKKNTNFVQKNELFDSFHQTPSIKTWQQLHPIQKMSYVFGSISMVGCASTLWSSDSRQNFSTIQAKLDQYCSPQNLPQNLQQNFPASEPIKNIPFSLFPTAHASAQMDSNHNQYMSRMRVDGVLYPSLQSYMTFQGYYPGTRNFDKFGPHFLVGIMAAITLGYQLSQNVIGGEFGHKIDQIFLEHLTLSYDNRKKPWTYFTNTLTHFTPFHFIANAMALTSFAPSVGVMSPLAFVTMFCGLAVTTSVLSLSISTGLARTLLRAGKARPALLNPAVGASGVLAAMVLVSALTNPNSQISILGLTPSFNILTGVGVFMGLDLCGLIAQVLGYRSGLSHAGHLSGYLCGLGLFTLAKYQYETKYPRGTYKYYGNWIERTLINGGPVGKIEHLQ